MSILYADEHFSCYNYEQGQNAALEILKRPAGFIIERDLHETQIVFIIDGRFTLSYGKHVDLEITKGRIMLFPPGSHVKATVIEDTHLIICRIKGILQLCECLPLEKLSKEYPVEKDKFHTLLINERIYDFIEFFVQCVDDGLRCSYYFTTKMKELFFLLRAYYTKEELAAFFSPLRSKDSQFMELMYKNYRKVNTVQELAEVSLYSPSGFKKHFNQVFGTSASEWLSNQKAALIFSDLHNSPLSIKELADKYGFASVPSFNKFCTSKFGKPPGKMRTENKHTDEENP